ncbi:MAG: hypothetical protein Q8R07_04910, partial [Candidatus Uhrbacteria bacterium]|nr:hypothetical protein [Candidatus Uhrbacteria bacterium]
MRNVIPTALSGPNDYSITRMVDCPFPGPTLVRFGNLNLLPKALRHGSWGSRPVHATSAAFAQSLTQITAMHLLKDSAVTAAIPYCRRAPIRGLPKDSPQSET